MRQILVTHALPYANGPLHLGHMVGYVQTDIWVRFQRMCGHEVHFVAGEDAHGTPIMLAGDEMYLVPAHALEAHPDVGLDVAHHVAQVQRTVGVGQGVSDQDLAHGVSVGERAWRRGRDFTPRVVTRRPWCQTGFPGMLPECFRSLRRPFGMLNNAEYLRASTVP
eukprot:TRINITY_DN16354_c0_g1_i5.p4 TRINITY_DN16354_c0_g1~~TRINITY_DN16354_c0_g1_i5.p4  ORF type:complete len:165 (-),score=4.06 TRINITY_DN16354_c0_g1_i5:221-715(-)